MSDARSCYFNTQPGELPLQHCAFRQCLAQSFETRWWLGSQSTTIDDGRAAWNGSCQLPAMNQPEAKRPYPIHTTVIWANSPEQHPRDNPKRLEITTFKLSGNSERPAYPGFMVMQGHAENLSAISVPSKVKRLTLAAIAL